MNLWFHCPGCKLHMHIGEEFAGHLVACPDCSTRFIVPASSAPEFAEAADEPEEDPTRPQPPASESPTHSPPAPSPDVPFFQTLAESAPDGQVASPALGRRRSERRPVAAASATVAPDRVHFAGAEEFDDEEFIPDPPAEPSLSKPSAKIDPEELIDMTAMVDIVFFLLIFFLVTSMHALDSSIAMPVPDPQEGAGAAAAEPSTLEEFETNEDYIVVHIERNNLIEIDGVPLRDVHDLVAKLRELHAAAPHPNKLLVVGDGEASHGTMVSVLDAGHDAGLERVRMAISGQDEEE